MPSWPDRLPSGNQKRSVDKSKIFLSLDHVACGIVNANH